MITFTSIMPCFDRYPKEAAIVGRLLGGYGELEHGLHLCLGAALGGSNDDYTTAFRVLFRMVGGGENRVETADLLMRRAYISVGLQDGYAAMIGGMRRCKKARNQYAHCVWFDDKNLGLFFIDMDAAARMGEPQLTALHVDEVLLAEQEKFFCYILQWMAFLQHEYLLRAGKETAHAWKAPAIMHPPNLHNPQDQHPPPWSGLNLGPLLKEPPPVDPAR